MPPKTQIIGKISRNDSEKFLEKRKTFTKNKIGLTKKSSSNLADKKLSRSKKGISDDKRLDNAILKHILEQ